jgi:hypothetical protein
LKEKVRLKLINLINQKLTLTSNEATRIT